MKLTDATRDTAVLVALLIISALPYLGGLGFYSDDWSFLEVMGLAPDQSFLGIQKELYEVSNLVPRPLQVLQLGASYALFGLTAFHSHLVNHAILGLAMVVLYLALRRLTGDRVISFAIVAIYMLLPNFSTTRFWFAAFQANVSLLWFAVSFYAATRYAAQPRPLWVVLAAVGMILSVLAYEMFLPLFPLIGLALLVTATSSDMARCRASVTLLVGAAALVIASVVFKLYAAGGERDFHGNVMLASLRLYGAALKVAVLDFGLNLPFGLTTVASRSFNLWPLVVAVANASISGAWLYVIARANGVRSQSWRPIGLMALFGVLCFVGGYGVLLQNFHATFQPPTGMGNRVSVAAAFGVALATTAAFLGISSLGGKHRPVLLAILVAFAAGGGSFLLSTIGTYWARSVTTQNTIIAGIRSTVPDLGQDDTLLLYGACPSDGPAPVFSSSWDLAGRLQLAYSTTGIRADVIKPNSVLTAGAIVLEEYGYETEYRFRRLRIYDARQKRVTPIPDAAAATAFFSRHPISEATGCVSIDGGGTPILQ